MFNYVNFYNYLYLTDTVFISVDAHFTKQQLV